MEKLDTGLVAKANFNDQPVELEGIGGFRLPRARGVTGKFRLFGHYVHVQFLLLAISELVVIFSISVAIYNYFLAVNTEVATQSALEIGTKIALMSIVFVFFMVAMGLYDTRQRERLSGLVMRLIAALFFAGIAMTMLYQLIPSLSAGDGLLKASALASVSSLALVRALFYKFIDGRVLLRRVLVVGAGKNALFIDRLRRKADMRGFHLVGFVESEVGQASQVDQSRILSFDESLCAYAQANEIDEIVLALDDRRRVCPQTIC